MEDGKKNCRAPICTAVLISRNFGQ